MLLCDTDRVRGSLLVRASRLARAAPMVVGQRALGSERRVAARRAGILKPLAIAAEVPAMIAFLNFLRFGRSLSVPQIICHCQLANADWQ